MVKTEDHEGHPGANNKCQSCDCQEPYGVLHHLLYEFRGFHAHCMYTACTQQEMAVGYICFRGHQENTNRSVDDEPGGLNPSVRPNDVERRTAPLSIDTNERNLSQRHKEKTASKIEARQRFACRINPWQGTNWQPRDKFGRPLW